MSEEQPCRIGGVFTLTTLIFSASLRLRVIGLPLTALTGCSETRTFDDLVSRTTFCPDFFPLDHIPLSGILFLWRGQ